MFGSVIIIWFHPPSVETGAERSNDLPKATNSRSPLYTVKDCLQGSSTAGA